MRLAAAALLLASCQTADRWNASVARGDGDIDGYGHDLDMEETTLELGISGPLWTKPDVRRETYCPAPIVQPAPALTPTSSTDWIGPVAAAIVAIIGALAGVRYIPSKAFDGPFDKKKA